jgi:gliding motility-associated-like protein
MVAKRPKKYKILPSEPATITGVTIKDFTANENSVLIEYTGVGNYEFSLDSINFQGEPLFNSVNPGIYNAIARDKNGCGLSNSYQLIVLDYPRFFTPNGDSYNDIWYVKNLDQLPDYTISIFDRYGKLVKQMNQNSSGWTGLFNGQQLPADDYWFNLIFSDGRNVKGHFSLKR